MMACRLNTSPVRAFPECRQPGQIIGFIAKIAIVWMIGIIVLVVGIILVVLGMAGHAVGGRKHYF
jgi:hypothetical protein